jgi:hypothetical protein
MATITTDKPQIAEIPTGGRDRPRHARHHRRGAQERALRDGRRPLPLGDEPRDPGQHDEFPMITDPRGRMVVGQFGAYINEMMEEWDRGVFPGDVILTSDPFKCSASISHTNDWLVLVPIFYEDELVGWSSQFGHMMDAAARSRLAADRGEDDLRGGIIIPPVKIIERGGPQEDVLQLIFNNVRCRR